MLHHNLVWSDLEKRNILSFSLIFVYNIIFGKKNQRSQIKNKYLCNNKIINKIY